MNSKEEKQLLQWFEEITTDEAVTDSDDDYDDAPSEHSAHNTGTEQSEQSSDEESNAFHSDPGCSVDYVATAIRDPVFVGKDKTEWLKHKPQRSKTKTRAHNLITQLPGVRRCAKEPDTELKCWKLFFSDEVITEIVNFTNLKLTEMRSRYNREKDCPPTDITEMHAFLGLLYMAGVKKGEHLNTDELWCTDGTAPEYFAAVMSRRRFHTLLAGLRFDDISTRKDRSKYDNLAPIRNLFQNFVNKCSSNYNLGEYVTIDEMLEGFRGRCRFRQYISNKPAKYGIKIYSLVEARTFYTHNMEIYAGRQPQGPYQLPNDAASVVKRLITTIDNSGRNVTMDNYFTSVPLANDLLVNHKLTIVGTLRKNKREIPHEFLNVKNRPVHSSMFAYGKNDYNCLLVSYVPKKNKNVLMLSTFHDDDTIDTSTNEAKKPEVITFYNLTKGGVDVVDRLKSEYSVTRKSNRWPLTIFSTLLNIATINSQIIYKSNTNKIMPRRSFITQLSKQLVTPHLKRRATISTLSIPLRQKIANVSGIKLSSPDLLPQEEQSKARCKHCPIRKNRFTMQRCVKCVSPMCKEHTATVVATCISCAAQEGSSDE